MQRFLTLLTLLTFLTLLTTAHAQNKDEKAIRQLLARQAADWNRGSIEGYMKGYWENDSLLFIGRNGPAYGYRTTLENYKKGYPDTAAMGKLSFDFLRLERLAADRYFVVGKWMLHRSIGNLQGHFTLLLRKFRNQWVIVADHSS
jgi:ketosteroid isomerase-like protein